MSTPDPDPYPWLPLADVLTSLGLGEQDPAAERIARHRLASCAYVERMRADLRSGPLTSTADVFSEGEYGSGVYGSTAVLFRADPAIIEGTLLLIARLHARKGSPLGLASFGEFGPASIARLDVDIERLLGLGRNAPPAVG